MFILTPTETFKATVKVNVATPSGAWREESFVGVFKRSDEEQREELLELKNTELLKRVMVGWEMVDEERKPVEFNDQNFGAFLRLIGACREAAKVYWQHNSGAKQKN
ncbi:hypothetical protein [Acidovorax sp. BLS4]|uniref:hypothetical protein n=1 Tax=Acidovorax sp. BLS4 TaxID=3273430 RepID=UPI00294383F3|nr:hypothetical protein [Paracidovorax avenae]WOI43786.1 hypothetical protein R1Z03_14700 [Paracidovorax avenae]